MQCIAGHIFESVEFSRVGALLWGKKESDHKNRSFFKSVFN